MKKIFLLLAAAGLLLSTTARAAESIATLQITGMTCDQCAASVGQSHRVRRAVLWQERAQT